MPRPTAVLAALLLLAAATARAQEAAAPASPLASGSRVGILFPAGTGLLRGDAADDALRAQALASADQALRALHYEVRSPADVLLTLNDTDVRCERGMYHCPPHTVLQALGLDAVVLLAIWLEGDGPANMSVEVTMRDRVGQARGVIDGDPKKQIPELLMRALADTDNGRAVRLQIDTVPTGAEVSIDDSVVGISPLTTESRFTPGPHEVTLAKPGYVTTTTHFEVPRGASDPFVQAAKMDPKEAMAPVTAKPPPDDERPTAAWDIALASGLGIVGAVLVVSPVRTIADGSGCRGDTGPSGYCNQASFGLTSGFRLGVGVAALGLATYTLLALPIRATLSKHGDSVDVSVAGSF